MRLRVPELLEKHGLTAYELSKRSDGRISMTAAYRLASGEFKAVSGEVLEAICDVFGIDDPGPLFERRRKRRSS